MPAYIKVIVLAQAATILSLTVAMHQVYLNDVYFQQYVISVFTSNILADVLLSTVTASVFALGTFTLLGSMNSTQRLSKEWRLLSGQAEAPSMLSIPVLEVVEQPSKPLSTSSRPRQRRRKTIADTERLYDSMRHFADDQGQR